MRLLVLIFVGSILCFGSLYANTNDSITASLLLKRIQTLQIQKANYFPVGSFESYREYTMNKGQVKADFNPFFIGLICFTLRNLYLFLDQSDQLIATQIIESGAPVINLFKNKNGRDTYNFWTADRKLIFPNSGWLNWFDKSSALPDDLDDTVISMLALDTDKETAKKVHLLMQGYLNGTFKKINNTYPEYENMPFYSTWFGNKMPIDLDISVLSNILYFVNKYELPYTKADSASLNLIVQVLQNKQYLTEPAYISPWYKRVPLILYHLSRLMQLKSIPALEIYRPVLIADAYKSLAETTNFLDKVMLSTTLYRFGKTPPLIQMESKQSMLNLIEEEKFALFFANLPSYFPNPYKRWASSLKLGMFNYYTPAYNQLLLLENVIWKKRHDLALQKGQ